MPNSSSLENKTMTGLFWSFMDLMSRGGIQLGLQIIMARLLLPHHFGLIGMIMVFIALSNTLIDSGFSQALIRDKKTTQLDYSTVFYFNLLVSLLAYGILYMSAKYISAFYNEPQLIEIIKVISVVLIINALGIIQRVKLVKEIDFKTITKVSIFSVVISGFITIIIALLGFGVWSLVINMVLTHLIQTVSLWFYSKWIPSFAFSYKSFKKYFGFGSKLLASSILDTIYNNVYSVIIGKTYSTSQLGYYSNALKFRDFTALSISNAVERVSYPVLSSIQDDENRLKMAFEKIIKTSGFVNFPLMIGLAAVATPAFGILLGEKWLPSVIYFQLLCIAGMLFPIHIINLSILQVKGRSDLFLRIEVIKKCILTVLIVLAVIGKTGIIGLIVVAVVNSYISMFVNTYFSGKEVAYSTAKQLTDLLPAFIISIVMGLTVFWVGSVLPMNYLFTLTIQIGIGVSMYIVLCKICKVKELMIVYHIIRKGMTTRKPFIKSKKEKPIV